MDVERARDLVAEHLPAALVGCKAGRATDMEVGFYILGHWGHVALSDAVAREDALLVLTDAVRLKRQVILRELRELVEFQST